MTSSFVVYRLPGQSKISFNSSPAFVVKDLNCLNDSHFVMAPFDDQSEWSIFAFDANNTRNIEQKEWNNLNLEFASKHEDVYHATAKEHQNQVQQIVEEIKKGDIQKVVLSRIQSQLRNNKSLKQIFSQLCEKYPNAFVYLCQLPNGQIWCGASPETLAKYEEGKFETMALAGTKALLNKQTDQLVWQQKEQDEQVWVQDYIKNILSNKNLECSQSDTYTAQAGPVAHIRTDFSSLTNPKTATELLQHLHPTPAVCGTPTQASKDYLLQLEKHDRKYYAGFIGIYAPQKFQLFVNLRCMQIDKNNFHLYLGGGITADSIAKDEYQETVNKACTLGAIL